MRDYMTIGSTPCDEECTGVGAENYDARARVESNQFIDAIRKKLGNEPDGARLAIKSFPHDFGTYHEVVCYFDTDKEESVEYAYRCESDSPNTWAEVGMTAPDFIVKPSMTYEQWMEQVSNKLGFSADCCEDWPSRATYEANTSPEDAVKVLLEYQGEGFEEFLDLES